MRPPLLCPLIRDLRSDESGDVIKRSQSNDDVFELFDVLD